MSHDFLTSQGCKKIPGKDAQRSGFFIYLFFKSQQQIQIQMLSPAFVFVSIGHGHVSRDH